MRHKIKLQRLSQLTDSSDGALLFDFNIGVALEQRVFGVFPGGQYQRALVSALGYRQRHRAFPALTQPDFQILNIAGRFQDHLAGRHPVAVKLKQEGAEHLFRLLLALAGQREGVRPQHLAPADIHHLGHRVQSILRQGDDVLRNGVRTLNILLLHQAPDIPDAVAQLTRPLILHMAGGLHHIVPQLIDDGLVLAAQEAQHLFHYLAVLFPGAFARARPQALPDVIVDTGADRLCQRQI